MLEKIKSLAGQKVTILKFSEFGYPVQIHCTILDAYLKDYAQYKDILHVEFRPKNKRKDFYFQVQMHTGFIIWLDHVEVEKNMYVKYTKSENCEIGESLLSFDPEYLRRALRSTEKKPFLLFSKDLENEKI